MSAVIPCSLPITQTPNTQTISQDSQINGLDEAKAIWGRLYSTYIGLSPVDLHKSTFTIGRAADCDVIITEKTFPRNRYQNVSKIHFLISKEPAEPPYIKDLSKNGTFVNGKLIGKGKKYILQNDDEISIGFKTLKVYIYKQLSKEDDRYLPPALRNQYEVSRMLGIGACGEVKLVFGKWNCSPYAIKKITLAKQSQTNKINHVSKIKNEISILQSLSHPNIVAMKDIVETDEAVFIVLEYLEGGELSDYFLSVVPLTETQIKFLFYQILIAVKYLHDQGVTHRDLKPENVLLKYKRPNSILKITDFGLSKIIEDDETIMRTVCGTPYYVAPEILDRSVSKYDQQVDIWSIGVILFYMLSQELPFKSVDKNVQFKLITNGLYKMESGRWTHVSDDAKNLVRRMLTVNPEQRIKIDEIFKHPWISEDEHTIAKVEQMIYEEEETMLEDDLDLTILAPSKRRKCSMEETSIRPNLDKRTV